jgi:hypothetical protein
MTRTSFGSLVAGGLNWESLPLKLFAGGNAKFWDPAWIGRRSHPRVIRGGQWGYARAEIASA